MTQEQADFLVTYIEKLQERTNHQAMMREMESDGYTEAGLDAACRVLGEIAGRDFSIL